MWRLLLLALPACSASATCTQEFLYRSDRVELAIMENFGSDRPLLEIISEGEKALAMVRGWEQEHASDTSQHQFSFACGQNDHATHWVGDARRLERQCSAAGAAATLSEMLHEMGWSGQKIEEMQGYTIQVAFLPRGMDTNVEMHRWEERLPAFDDPVLPVAIRIEGDCIQQSIWLHRYPSGAAGVRFGIFHHYRSALEAIKRLQLPANHAQILPQTFLLDRLEDYIQH